METNPLSGSAWNIWDLHVHSPASLGGSDYETFIQKLAFSEATVIGINDYNTIQGYKTIKNSGGVPNKVIFPVMECRMHNIVANRKNASGGSKINFHIIFSNEESLFGKIENFINSLPCFDDSGRTALLGSIQADQIMKISFDFKEVLKKLEEVNLKDNCLIWLPYDEYGGIDDIDPEDNFFKLHLIRSADILGSGREKQINYFKWKNEKFDESHYKQFMDAPKPCLKGSDSHEFEYPFGRLRDENSAPTNRFCWIKADLTFNGLRQIIYEPDRVFIGKEPELITRQKETPHRFISGLVVNKEPASRINELWFDNLTIDFNSGLIAIIGKKGNGKSAIADILGLCGNSRNSKDDLSFLHRDKFKNPKSNKAKEFKAILNWLDDNNSGDVNLNSDINLLAEEKIKYIPQNYLEKLCVSEEQKEFDEELKKIIFAHIPDREKLGQNSLDDLISLNEKSFGDEIGKLQVQVASINKSIARLELKKKASYRKNIEQEIRNKQTEIQHHDENKPLEKTKPEENEEQKAANAKILEVIEGNRSKIADLQKQKRELEAELSLNKISITELSLSNNEITALQKTINRITAEQKIILDKHGIDINNVIQSKIDTSAISEKIQGFEKRNKEINELLIGSDKNKGIEKEIQDLNIQSNELQNQLLQGQKEYQEYLQTLNNWNERRTELIGAVEKYGSLLYFENELKYVDEKLSGELNIEYDKRKELAREIFNNKLQLLEIYKRLYQPVTQVLEKESSFVEEYNIKVNASLEIRAFQARFLAFINQKSKGSFAGTNEGIEMADELISFHSVTNQEDMESFLNAVEETLNFDLRKGYGKEKRYVDEQLRKDIKIEDLYDFLYGLNFIEPKFKLQLGSKDLKQLSPGERGAILLIFYLFLDIDNKPLIIDQPEENLDNESIYYYLVHFIKKAKSKRQIIIITHNPNLAVVCDAEQIIHMSIDKQNQNLFSYISGSIENPKIASAVINILEGTKPAFDNRRLKYQSVIHD